MGSREQFLFMGEAWSLIAVLAIAFFPNSQDTGGKGTKTEPILFSTADC
ncbi:MAG TPA: hypothetical protein V6C95_01745 [Coleofasciculaceae cyanobacterium]